MEATCPEVHPFNFRDGSMCCAVQPVAGGHCLDFASNCYTHHPETGIDTCADHPTAVRVEGNSFYYGHIDFFVKKLLGTYKGQKFRKSLVICYTKYIKCIRQFMKPRFVNKTRFVGEFLGLE